MICEQALISALQPLPRFVSTGGLFEDCCCPFSAVAQWMRATLLMGRVPASWCFQRKCLWCKRISSEPTMPKPMWGCCASMLFRLLYAEHPMMPRLGAVPSISAPDLWLRIIPTLGEKGTSYSNHLAFTRVALRPFGVS